MDIRPDLISAMSRGSVTLAALEPGDLPDVHRDEVKVIEMELRAQAANGAVLRMAEERRGLLEQRHVQLARLNELHRGIYSDPHIREEVRRQTIEELQRLALTMKRLEILEILHDKLQADWSPLATLAAEMRTVLNNRPKPDPGPPVQEMTGEVRHLLTDYHDGLASNPNPPSAAPAKFVQLQQAPAVQQAEWITGLHAKRKK
ncbi:hypothetical protein [Luteimonas saliphila]|uniref:hypothetical protein n=1 Tax=Luteimonas saliphila TaxID=2804919 RepID=UPI00192DA975|nr:hypothetical protein [Luteimonas saliphila]